MVPEASALASNILPLDADEAWMDPAGAVVATRLATRHDKPQLGLGSSTKHVMPWLTCRVCMPTLRFERGRECEAGHERQDPTTTLFCVAIGVYING